MLDLAKILSETNALDYLYVAWVIKEKKFYILDARVTTTSSSYKKSGSGQSGVFTIKLFTVVIDTAEMYLKNKKKKHLLI
jgi:hypothetical protein